MKNEQQEKLKDRKSYTAWHIFLADVMDYLISPEDMEVRPFEKLGTLPLESDFILIRKKKHKELEKKYPDFKFMIPYLGKYTIIEYKSPLDTLGFQDFDIARAYMLLLKRKYHIDYDKDIHIISMASKFKKGYRKHIENNGYKYHKLEKGIMGDSAHKFF